MSSGDGYQLFLFLGKGAVLEYPVVKIHPCPVEVRI
jgi:hypothetical protein